MGNHGEPDNLASMEKVQIPPFYLANLGVFQGCAKALGARYASNQKVA